MDPVDQIQEINVAFQEILSVPEKAELSPSHKTDDLMVWFLMGGKDVGKSTFLNALLDTDVSHDHPDSAEGTERFVAYIHKSARSELEARLNGLPIDLHFHTHESEFHERLCLIDSPDFDSRFFHHAGQVQQVIESGVSDGAVLLTSPEKYKNRQYWETFQRLSGSLSPRHLLFVLTKADELGDYLDEVRADFGQTIAQRLRPLDVDSIATESDPRGSRIFLINSLDRAIDFAHLEMRLMRRLSALDVRSAQQENLRHTITRSVRQIREHYQLDEVRERLHQAMARERIDELCEEHFPEAYFQAVWIRLASNRELANTVRERLWMRPEGTLAGIPAIMAGLHWLNSLNPFRSRFTDPESREYPLSPSLERLMRWGQEDLAQRLLLAQKETLSPLTLEPLMSPEHGGEQESTVLRDMHQLLEDHLAQPLRKMLSWPLRTILNLPVYLYLIFFILLLLSPVLPLLRAGDVFSVPELSAALTLDSVKVAVTGFLGYYVMAILYVIRKQRDRVCMEVQTLAHCFVADMRPLIQEEVLRPLNKLAKSITRLEEQLDRTAVLD